MVFTDLPFLGRADEMSRLREKLSHAVNHRGSCVFINGNPGVGKSSFVSEFIGKKVDPDVFVLKIEIRDLTNSDQQLLFSVVREYLKTVRTLKSRPTYAGVGIDVNMLQVSTSGPNTHLLIYLMVWI